MTDMLIKGQEGNLICTPRGNLKLLFTNVSLRCACLHVSKHIRPYIQPYYISQTFTSEIQNRNKTEIRCIDTRNELSNTCSYFVHRKYACEYLSCVSLAKHLSVINILDSQNWLQTYSTLEYIRYLIFCCK